MSSSTELARYMFAAIFFIGGCFFSWGFWRALAHRRRMLHDSARVAGRVVKVKEVANRGGAEDRGGSLFMPVVEFAGPDGGVSPSRSCRSCCDLEQKGPNKKGPAPFYSTLRI